MLLAQKRETPGGRGDEMPVDGERAEAEANRGMTRSRLAAGPMVTQKARPKNVVLHSCVATNLTIRRINRRDSAIAQVIGGAALGAAMQRNLVHYFTWQSGYESQTSLPLPHRLNAKRIPVPLVKQTVLIDRASVE